ncbi:hypothetical protein HELRODRAFT_177368 [Helobdella robusta]|uniref:C-type lectin domain-containing protein n=1 Tax=Helobdella robusta TaxID=6412 RepID=T1FBK6_HELRO|nr:hypothetical protein HELRODRAFT_177368 [Helobdella robusta]ESN98128.1 hypothetical protein HELRODRAFT_177368 [Helobdella robusta]
MSNNISKYCNNKYCLYTDNPKLHTVDGANTTCLMHNMHGWMIEIFDLSVKTLLDEFLVEYDLSYKYILLNTKILNGWSWIGDEKKSFNTENLQSDPTNPFDSEDVGYLSVNSSSRFSFQLYATSAGANKTKALCQINS